MEALNNAVSGQIPTNTKSILQPGQSLSTVLVQAIFKKNGNLNAAHTIIFPIFGRAD